MGQRTRRIIGIIVSIVLLAVAVFESMPKQEPASAPAQTTQVVVEGSARDALSTLPVKGRAPKTGYIRDAFGDGWKDIAGCDTRNIILHRDLINTVLDEDCKVLSGQLNDPYTGTTVMFTRTESSKVQIDHVVALSDAWQKGAQLLTPDEREQFANDPIELIAVDGAANQAKGDADAATWLPPRQSFRCPYVARQIAVKQKYSLWVTQAEHDAMAKVLEGCPQEPLPIP